MDDEAPESDEDDPLRERRYQQGTACDIVLDILLYLEAII
jgi:hypothetical protein